MDVQTKQLATQQQTTNTNRIQKIVTDHQLTTDNLSFVVLVANPFSNADVWIWCHGNTQPGDILVGHSNAAQLHEIKHTKNDYTSWVHSYLTPMCCYLLDEDGNTQESYKNCDGPKIWISLSSNLQCLTNTKQFLKKAPPPKLAKESWHWLV